MNNNKYVIEVVFDFSKILLADKNKETKDFLDFLKKAIKGKLKKTEETEETEDFMDTIMKKIKKIEEKRKNFIKYLLEELLKSEEDEDKNLFVLIDMFVAKEQLKKIPKHLYETIDNESG